MSPPPPYVTDAELRNGRSGGLTYRATARHWIKTLELGGKGKDVTPKKLATFPNVIAVNLASNSKCDFAYLLGCIAALPTVQRLDLAWNEFTSIPREITLLKGLRYLKLTRNKLAKLGPEIFELPWLEFLCLAGNSLKEIPERLGDLQLLRHLELWDNKIHKLPDAIRRLQGLELLRADSNKPLDVNDAIDKIQQMPRLERLDLSESGSTRPLVVNDALCKCRSLRWLGLGWMKISKLPSAIGDLTQLEYLELTGNELTELPASIIALQNLEDLSLNKNPLPAKKTCALLGKLTRLKHVTVRADDQEWERHLLPLGFLRTGSEDFRRA